MADRWPVDLLIPRPRRCHPTPMVVVVAAKPFIFCEDARAQQAGRWLCRALAAEGLEPRLTDGRYRPLADPPDEETWHAVFLRVDPNDEAAAGVPDAVRHQGYTLSTGNDASFITGFGEAGLLHGAATLTQLVRLRVSDASDGGAVVPRLRITDWPDFPVRGVMLDISRDKVPSMDTLEALIDLLAGLKINQLQLYMEHTFAYAGHEKVWRDASPLTAEEVQALDARCAEGGIDLVPNQNSLGHFHRWLKHEPYRQLAERPEGFDHPFSRVPEPFSLCPEDPGALELLADLYDQLLPNFRDTLFNVGLDETMDVGTGRSSAACEERGTVEVYLEYLLEVHALVRRRGRTMQFWGDIIIKRPDLIDRLPEDAIALEWGYEAGHPFERHAPCFASSGRAYYVCPGTSSWNSLGGRVHNALHNLARAATVGHEHGASGYLITDWGDYGHLQPLPVSYPGFLAGAGFSWSTDAARQPDELPLVELLAAHAPELGDGGARALVQLGDAYRRTGAEPVNGTVLFWLLSFADGDLRHRRFRDLSAEGLARAEAHLAGVAGRLDELDDASPRVRAELAWVCGLLAWAARLGQARLEHGAADSTTQLPADARAALTAELEPLIRQHGPVWLGRNRPGGQADSLTWLTRVRDLLS